MEKNKKRTLTISSNLKKKIDTSSIASSTKKSYAVDKKKPFFKKFIFPFSNANSFSSNREIII